MNQFAHYLPGMLVAYGAFTLAVMSPGPNMIAVIGTAMGAGRRPGMALAFGISVGSLGWGVLAIIGLTSVIAKYASAITAIRLFGVAYLLWLALRSFQSAMAAKPIEITRLSSGKGDYGYFRSGMTVQMTNPKAAFTWVAILTVVVDPSAPVWVGTSIVLGVGVLSLFAYMAYALIFSSTLMIAAYNRWRRWIEVGLGVFFSLASYKLLRG
jgi:amino acid exporter